MWDFCPGAPSRRRWPLQFVFTLVLADKAVFCIADVECVGPWCCEVLEHAALANPQWGFLFSCSQDSLHIFRHDSRNVFSCLAFWSFFMSILYTFIAKVILFHLQLLWCSLTPYCEKSVRDPLYFRLSCSLFPPWMISESRANLLAFAVSLPKGDKNIFVRVGECSSQRFLYLHQSLLRGTSYFLRASLHSYFFCDAWNCFHTILFPIFQLLCQILFGFQSPRINREVGRCFETRSGLQILKGCRFKNEVLVLPAFSIMNCETKM